MPRWPHRMSGRDIPHRKVSNQISAAGERARALTRRILMFGRAQPDTRKSISLITVIEDAFRLLRATLPVRITLTLETSRLHRTCSRRRHSASSARGESLYERGPRHRQQPGEHRRFAGRRDAVRELPAALNLQPGEYVCLSVTDTGAGIDPHIRDRIFEPFFTTETSRRRCGTGALGRSQHRARP